jgi:hypothetical protein
MAATVLAAKICFPFQEPPQTTLNIDGSTLPRMDWKKWREIVKPPAQDKVGTDLRDCLNFTVEQMLAMTPEETAERRAQLFFYLDLQSQEQDQRSMKPDRSDVHSEYGHWPQHHDTMHRPSLEGEITREEPEERLKRVLKEAVTNAPEETSQGVARRERVVIYPYSQIEQLPVNARPFYQLAGE